MKTVPACRNPQSLESDMNILYENGYDKIGKDGRSHSGKPKVPRQNQRYENNAQSRGNWPQRFQTNYDGNNFHRRNQQGDHQHFTRQNQQGEQRKFYRTSQQNPQWQWGI